MKKNIITLLCLVLYVALLAGCQQEKVEVFIHTGIDYYSPLMSSVPGMPLERNFKTKDSIRNVRYHWKTDYGDFLEWNHNVKVIGKSLINHGERIYLSILHEETNISSFKVYLEVEEETSKRIIAKTSIEFEVDEGKSIVLKK